MKTFLKATLLVILTFLTLSISESIYSQKLVDSVGHDMRTLNSIEFNSLGAGLTVGNNGFIFITSDNGANWTQVFANTTANFSKTILLGENKVLAVGHNGTVMISADMGLTWDAVDMFNPELGTMTSNLLDVSVNANGIGFAVGEAGAYYHSTDFGATWTKQELGKTCNLNAVSFFNNQNAMVVGDENTVLVTSDGGITWDIPTGTRKGAGSISHDFKSLTVTDVSTAYATTKSGDILRTTDLGFTWQTLYSDTTVTLNKVVMLSSGVLFAEGSAGTILSSIDSGATWVAKTSNTQNTLNSMFFTSETVGFAVGVNGLMLKTEDAGSNWTAVDYVSQVIIFNKTKPSIEKISNYPNPFNPSTTITYSLPFDASVTLRIYDMIGREVSVLVNSFQKEGLYRSVFNAAGLSSGIYFYKLIVTSGNNRLEKTMKMVLTK